MNRVRFDHLCRQTCHALGHPDPEVLTRTGEITVDGVTIAVHFDEADEPDCIFCYADLGRPEPAHRVDVMEQLLALNLLHGSSITGLYAMNPQSGHAVSCVHLRDVDALDGEYVAQTLRLHAAETVQVRELVQSPCHTAFSDSIAAHEGLVPFPVRP